MEQGTANAIAAIVGMLGGKVLGDVQETRQAQAQRAFSLNDIKQKIASNPEYAKDPNLLAQLQSMNDAPQPTTGELFKKMFFGSRPELVNADISMLQNAMGLSDKKRLAKVFNDTYNPATPLTAMDMNDEAMSILAKGDVPKQMGVNIQDDNKKQGANWVAKNARGLIRSGMTAGGDAQGNLNYLEPAPAGLDPKVLQDFLLGAYNQQQSNVRNADDNKTRIKTTGMNNNTSRANVQTQQAGATQRTGMTQAGANTRQATALQQQQEKDLISNIVRNIASKRAALQPLSAEEIAFEASLVKTPRKPRTITMQPPTGKDTSTTKAGVGTKVSSSLFQKQNPYLGGF